MYKFNKFFPSSVRLLCLLNRDDYLAGTVSRSRVGTDPKFEQVFQ
jgi:hypothetical protein